MARYYMNGTEFEGFKSDRSASQYEDLVQDYLDACSSVTYCADDDTTANPETIEILSQIAKREAADLRNRPIHGDAWAQYLAGEFWDAEINRKDNHSAE